MIRTFIASVLSLGLFTAAADAGLIVGLEARDVNGAALPSQVVAGTQAIVDVLLSVDGAEDPLPDLRLLQLDFSGTSTSITVDAFAWSVNGVAYSFQTTNPPTVSAATLLSVSSSILLTLTGTPVLVARVNVTINESGVFDVRNPDAPDTNFAARFSAGFGRDADDPITNYSLFDGNLGGGTISFTVAGTVDPGSGGGSSGGGSGGATDSDGDGVFDADDAFPSDPAETTDTNGNGVGDNADADDDADGVPDTTDVFPLDPAEAADTDSDSVGDNADAFPTDPTETTDSNGDGVGDNAGSNGDTTNPPTPTPVRVCGLGMLGPSLLIFAGLRCVSMRRRWSR